MKAQRRMILVEAILAFVLFVAVGVSISYFVSGEMTVLGLIGPLFCGFIFTVFVNIARTLFERRETETDEVAL